MKRIVVVDDDPQMGRLLKILFELEGYEVFVARQYGDILPTIREAQPDVVLMDVRVQGRETFHLLREMRRDQALAHIPVVMTSGMNCQRECLEAGANQFVLKPFVPDEMVRVVGSLVGAAG